ncbi:MAG: GNAT family N-acetyltransferase [Acidobacteria bacterium]|nr:MAG: GNAT family N-acetyltransferase [Acidobacteriota bacterium]MCE7956829.1 GNAT family N-acetyltransferase [Acidobacteria bacterium ACB2]
MKGRSEPDYREAGPEGLAAAAPLLERVFTAEMGAAAGPLVASALEETAARFDPSRDFVVLAEAGGEVVGALVAGHEGGAAEGSTSFGFWAVEAPLRGRGIGRELLRLALDRARSRGLSTLTARCLAVSPQVPRLFWAHGFRVSKLTGLPVGGSVRELVCFERRLAPREAPC